MPVEASAAMPVAIRADRNLASTFELALNLAFMVSPAVCSQGGIRTTHSSRIFRHRQAECAIEKTLIPLSVFRNSHDSILATAQVSQCLSGFARTPARCCL